MAWSPGRAMLADEMEMERVKVMTASRLDIKERIVSV